MGAYASIDRYTASQVAPFVADTLHAVGQQFTCRGPWTQAPFWNSKFYTAQLPPNARQGFGYGRRTGAVIDITTQCDVALGEFTWKVIDGRAYVGDNAGIVALKSSMYVRFNIERSVSEDFITGGLQRNGVLCQAYECTLPDGSTCMRLQPNQFTGMLWLRTATDAPRRPLRNMLAANGAAQAIFGKSCIVHLAETTCVWEGEDEGFVPWKNMHTTDESGRPWRVDQASLRFLGKLAADDAFSKPWLRKQERVALAPPYEAVWLPANVEQQYIGLTLM